MSKRADSLIVHAHLVHKEPALSDAMQASQL